jgi:hypothetical protein
VTPRARNCGETLSLSPESLIVEGEGVDRSTEAVLKVRWVGQSTLARCIAVSVAHSQMGVVLLDRKQCLRCYMSSAETIARGSARVQLDGTSISMASSWSGTRRHGLR